MQNKKTDNIIRVIRTASALLVLLFMFSCTAIKLVPEDQVLYTGSEIELVPRDRMQAKKKLKEVLYSNINPKPNTTILGMRPSLWIYYKMGNPKKGLKRFIKNKIGQVPVYLSDVDITKTRNNLKGYLINNGFFMADVKSKANIKERTASITYTAFVHRPYRIRNITLPRMDTLFENIDSIKRDSYLKKGQRYNLERLSAEQQRIEEALENLGFYFFDDRHLIFEADSTVGDREVDLTLTLEPGVPAKAKRIYRLDNINVFPDFALSLDTLPKGNDTLNIDGYHYIDRQRNYRPKVITNVINLEKGAKYKRLDREYTLSHLMSLGSFKFVNIKFLESKRDSATLDANVYLTPYMKKSIRAEFQATSKSNNFVGPGLELTFTNRNAFGGSERLDITLSSGYEVQVNRKQAQALNAIEVGGEAHLTIPRFVLPFELHYPNRRFLPSTDVRLGARIQNRVGFFNLNSFNNAYGFTWRENTLKSHEFYPIDINYVNVGNRSVIFEDLLARNPFLARSFENQFIPGARYVYTVNTQLNPEREDKFKERAHEPSYIFFTGRVDVAGNLIQAIQGRNFDQEENDAQDSRIFGQPYSQFSRLEIDFRHYWQLRENTQWVSRLNTGVGYAYGNSVTMPYIKQFAIGGSTSLRAFPPRSLGPGTYYVLADPSSENRNLFIDQRADMKIEANGEFRYEVSKVFKTALFIDAGNIWLLRADSTRRFPDDAEPRGQFRSSEFLKEIAVGAGAGVRFDFSFFILRFDLAMPLRKPWLPDGERWVINQLDFGSRAWRRENLTLNIAIGYPF